MPTMAPLVVEELKRYLVIFELKKMSTGDSEKVSPAFRIDQPNSGIVATAEISVTQTSKRKLFFRLARSDRGLICTLDKRS